ncbi:MAG: protein-disulfide reductase DsbD domain-containing protein [Verrucomicrobiota bacterium]|mgnify:CR=1 FL=1
MIKNRADEPTRRKYKFKRPGGFGIYTTVNRILTSVVAAFIAFFAMSADAAATRATLLLSANAAKPGDTITAAVRLEMSPGWHTYWKNSGASGIPTSIAWELPKGVTAGEISWPVPEKYVIEKVDADGKAIPGSLDYEQATYVHHDEAVLLVPLTIAPDAVLGRIEIKALVKWLECQVNCVPGKQEVAASLEIASATTPSSEAAAFQNWNEQLPKDGGAFAPKARWENTTTDKTRGLLFEWRLGDKSSAWDFFPDKSDDFEMQHQTDLVSTNNGAVVVRKLVTISGDVWPKEVSGLLVQKRDGKTDGYFARIDISGESAVVAGAVDSSAPVKEKKPLWLWLIYAFIGGLILNIMPCVLPVIALKILGFVGQAKEAPGRVRALGLVYAAGVLVSFLALAAVIIAIKAAGHKAGWGMQFSNPQFIVGMAALITLVALNLFGLFEVTLGGRTLGAAGELASQHGASGAFFNGVLATVLSTPCSAPFLGAALGFAFSQPAAIIILIFLTVGLGLAAPYVILSWQPSWLKFLPKPGAWMEKFKLAMGFPMLVTAVWLTSLVGTFYGEQSWWLGVFLVLLGAAAWVFGEFYQRGNRARGVGILFTILLLATGYLWALESGLDWRHPQQQTATGGKVANAPKDYPWQRWSPEAIATARAEGRVVVVDFTASWCQTCKISVQPGFEAKAVVEKLKQLNAVALLADYTTFPKELTEELEKFGRSAVPLVLVYPADASKPALVLPEPLPFPAPYAPVILNALEKM